MNHLENQITVINVCILAHPRRQAQVHACVCARTHTHTHTYTHCNTIPDTDAILHNNFNYYSYSAKLRGLVLFIITLESDAQSLFYTLRYIPAIDIHTIIIAIAAQAVAGLRGA